MNLNMTSQEIFDAVVARLRDGKGRALDNSTNFCMYKTSDGLSCAVGIFIPEGSNLFHVVGGVDTLRDKAYSYGEVELYAFLEKNNDLLAHLQDIHDADENWDKNEFNSRGEDGLFEAASEFNLIYRYREPK